MMLPDAFKKLVDRIAATGLDRATAAQYATRLASRPYVEGEHAVVKDDQRREIARLPKSVLGGTLDDSAP